MLYLCTSHTLAIAAHMYTRHSPLKGAGENILLPLREILEKILVRRVVQSPKWPVVNREAPIVHGNGARGGGPVFAPAGRWWAVDQ